MQIPLSNTGVTLEVEIAEPSGEKQPFIILAHPHPKMGGSMDNKVIELLFRRVQEKKWGGLRFNFRGVGKSSGAYDGGAGETEDLLQLTEWTEREYGIPKDQLTLVGYSFGSWISAKAAAAMSELSRLIVIAPPLKTMDFSVLEQSSHRKTVFAAGQDEFCPSELLEEWIHRLKPPKTVRVIPEADHFFVGKTTELIHSVIRILED